MRTKDEVGLEEMFSGSKRLAMKYGANAAIVHQTLAYHIKEAQTKKRNPRNGRYWYYATYSEITDKLPFLTERQVRSAIGILEKAHLITTAHFKGSPQPHTTWYDIPDAVMTHAYPTQKRRKQSDKSVSQSDTDVNQSDTNVSQSDTDVTSTNLIYTRNNTHIDTIQEKENNSFVIKEKEHFCSPAEYHKWKPLLLNNLRLDKTTYDAIQTLVSKYGEEEVQEYLHYWQKDGEKYHSTTELLDKVESDLRWKHRPQFYK